MDQPTSFKYETTPTSTMGINNQLIIIVLLVILGLSLLGINVFTMLGNVLESILDLFGPLVKQVLSIFGYTAGTVVEKTADVAGSVAETGVEVAAGSLKSVGSILKDASRTGVNPSAVSGIDNALPSLDRAIQSSKPSAGTYGPNTADHPVQKSTAAGRSGWCLVGEYDGVRGCVAVGETDKCMSRQIFPSQVACMDPSKYQSTN